MAVAISVRADVKQLQRQLDVLAKQQIPFATMLAVNATAARVVKEETDALDKVFDRPTPFTKRAFTMIRARKSNLTAMVYAREIQARYLEPSEVGGPQYLGSGKKIRTPVDIKLDSYGNIPRGAIQRALAKPNVFVGHVNGVGGLWERLPVRGRGRKGAAPGQQLRLLVAFTRPKVVKTRLGYRERAVATARAYFSTAFQLAIKQALATAR